MRFPTHDTFRQRLMILLAAVTIIAVAPEAYSPAMASAQNNSKKAAKTASKGRKRSASKESAKPVAKGKSRSASKSKTQALAKGKSKATPASKKGGVGPKSSAEAKKMQEAAQKEIQKTKEQISLNEQEIKVGLADLNLLSSEITQSKTRVSDLEKKLSALNTEITNIGNDISKNESDLKIMRDEYLKAVKKMRLTGRNQSALAFIFASESFNQAMRRLRYLRRFSAWKERRSTEIDGKIRRLQEEKVRLDETKQQQTFTLQSLTNAQAELQEKHGRQEKLVAGLRQNGDALRSHLASKQAEANSLKSAITNLIAQEQAKAEAERRAREKAEADRIAREKAEAEKKAAEKAAQEKSRLEKEARKLEEKKKKEEEKRIRNSEKGSRTKKDRKNKDTSVTTRTKDSDSQTPSPSLRQETPQPRSADGMNFVSLKGSLPRPVDGAWRITNPFGRHSMPELPEIVYDNPGIDAEVATGAPVKAVSGGKVSGVYKLAGYGTVVIVNHGEYYTVYGNLSSTGVSVGTQVSGGQVLGNAGADPDDARRGSVHFEVWKGREKQNPSQWIR